MIPPRIIARPSVVRVIVCRARAGALGATETGSEIWGANPEEEFKVTKDETIVGIVRLAGGAAAVAAAPAPTAVVPV